MLRTKSRRGRQNVRERFIAEQIRAVRATQENRTFRRVHSAAFDLIKAGLRVWDEVVLGVRHNNSVD